MPDRDKAFNEIQARANVPKSIAPLVGRAEDLARITSLLINGTERIVTLVGPGGIGKTRLALAVAAAITGTEEPVAAPVVAIVALTAVDTPTRVLPTIARKLGLVDEEERLPALLQDELRARRHLLVLDNFEHLLSAVPDLADLLMAAPQLQLLVTSRHPLRLPGERVINVPPLDTDAAARLFALRVERTPGAAPVRASDSEDVHAICDRVDRLPLAVELTAGWTRSVPPRELLTLLNDRLRRLRGVQVDDDPRHRSMRETIAWSYELLTADERALFRRLTVFVGGFTLDMAHRLVVGRDAGAGYPFAEGYDLPYPSVHQLGYDPTDTAHDRQDPSFARALSALNLDPLEGVTVLLDHSLLRRVDDGDTEARYEFLETIREFGRERLADSDEEAAVQHAHAAILLAFAEATSEGLFHANNRRWDRPRIDREVPNLRAALTWLLAQGGPAAELAQRLVGSQWVYWQTSGAVAEGRLAMERAFAIEGSPLWARAVSLPALGFLCWIQGDDERATDVLDEAVRISAEVGFADSEGSAHFYRALVSWRKGPAAVFDMVEHLENALALFQPADNAIGVGVCNLALGVIARMSGNYADAFALFDEASLLFQRQGYEWGIASAHYFAAEASRDLADQDPAQMLEVITALHEALRGYWALGDNWGAGGVISALACVAASNGNLDQAARLFGAADAMLDKIGAFLPPTDLDLYRAAAKSLRGSIGTARYDRAYTSGQALPATEAVEEALQSNAVQAPPVSMARLTDIQRALIREIARRFSDPQTFTIKELAGVLGRDYSSVHELLGIIAHKWKLPDRTSVARYVITHKGQLLDTTNNPET